MQRFISQRNIEHYRSLLAGCELDAEQRLQVAKLLAEELANQPPPETPNTLVDPVPQK